MCVCGCSFYRKVNFIFFQGLDIFPVTGHTNSGFSGTFSGNGSSDNLSDDHSNTPENSMHGGGVFPNRRKKSMAQVFIDKAMPNRKKKR